MYFFSNFFCSIQKIIICLITFSKFSDVLPAFTGASAIGNLSRICLGVNILSSVRLKNLRSETLVTRVTRAKSEERPLPFVTFVQNIPF